MHFRFLRTVLCSALAGACVALAAPVHAAADYPKQAVRVMVGFSAGGAVDNVARQIGEALSKRLGQAFVIENQAGATGTIAAETAARARPDGYTLLVATQSTMVVAPRMYPNLKLKPMQDLKPIALIGSVPLALVAHPSLPVKTVGDVIELAKKENGELIYASSGAGGPQHLAAELFASMAGVKMVHVPYKGEANAIADLIGNHVPLMFSNLPTLLPYIQSGQLRGIAVSGHSRAASAPELPTVAEAGLPGFDAQTWFALFAPAQTPDDVIEKLGAAVDDALQDRILQGTLASQGLTINALRGPALVTYMKDQETQLGKVVEAAGIKAD
ncbi:tripartite tricarboxylate transporter substrate binding protein [Lampropedia puyangensis]|uniref:Tripartite tricarboxylate transporter substrate binding protein n=2 Tax=Lampropedia puyangensis TaxID=1330072 RepID=A0A4S8FGC9_9BURK|nr:tripartite tricarboxylate transporter substrate binding protein [Lampropedia puyangensis]